MANHFYVKSGGTAVGATVDSADGVYSSRQTGTWSVTASEYYDSLYSLTQGTVKPADGDFVYVSDSHNKSYAPVADITFAALESGAGTTFVSVSDTDREAYSPGATEYTTNARNYRIAFGLVAGINLGTADDNYVQLCILVGQRITFQDCTIKLGTGTTDRAFSMITQDGESLVLINVDIELQSNTDYLFTAGNGSKVYWYGGSVTGAYTVDKLFEVVGNGGAMCYVEGVDLSKVDAVSNNLDAGFDNIEIKLQSCAVSSSLTFPTVADEMQSIQLMNCDDTTGDDLHRLHYQSGSGVAKNNDSTYVTATKTWYEGSVKSSIEVTTTAGCSHVSPFAFNLISQYVDLSQAASNVLTLELTTDTALTLTDTDIAAFLVYPDGTTAVQPNWVTSGKTVGTGNYGVDPLAAGTALTAGSLGAGDWTGEDATSPNFYKMVLDTSGDAGRATAVSIRIEVYKASIAAGTLFIHPLIQVSAA